jgi:DNA-binding MarR family transcriptional regulator
MASQLALGVVRLNRRLRHADSGGLTPSQSAALASVARAGEPTLGELAACEHVTPATMTPIIKRLEARRLVARVADADDGRVTRVRITPAGRRQLDENRSRRRSWLKSQLAELTDEERERLDGALDVLTKLTAVEAATA